MAAVKVRVYIWVCVYVYTKRTFKITICCVFILYTNAIKDNDLVCVYVKVRCTWKTYWLRATPILPAALDEYPIICKLIQSKTIIKKKKIHCYAQIDFRHINTVIY